MITNQQVKAARALLDWKQSDLAKAAGISLATLASIEQGTGSPRAATWQAIQQALEIQNIEFTDDPGVRLRREKFKLQILEGYESILEIWRDFESILPDNSEIMVAGVDERVWIKKYGDDFKAMIRRLRQRNFTSRILIAEGDTLLTNSAKNYRTIPKWLFQQTPYYVYADRVAIINWGPPQFVILMQNALIAETFRRQFEFNWEMGKKLDPKKVAIADMS
jgi:transcriptional regulator with XRE-family HTH domain